MVDIPGNSTTTVNVTVDSTVNGAIEVGGDHDWFRIDLTAGQIVQITLNGIGAAALEDPFLRIRNASGVVVVENDDGGTGRNAMINFQATVSGVYYIDVAAWDEATPTYNYVGDYQLVVATYQQPPVATIDAIARQLTHDYWDGDSHHFAVTRGGALTVNLTALTNDGQILARAALRQWTDIIGVTFNEVGSGGHIVFDDNEPGASSGGIWSNGIISSANVNVATAWLATNGTGINSYSFQTYIHEIGHALGLGHAGNYDGEAEFPTDALFLNDAWSTSVMSYFSPSENSHFSQRGFSDSFVGTPMLADIAAMGQLYGLSTTTRLGNTTYGFNSNAGNVVYDATVHPTIAYTVFDSGGIDTLDYSGFSQSQLIDLTPGNFSNIGGRNGSVAIAIGTTIENAIGGSGDDIVVASGADNAMNGGAGNDSVSYAAAAAGVTVSLALTGAQNTIGAGTDSLVGFEQLFGSVHGDQLTAGVGMTSVFAGDGNDTLISTADGDKLYGQAGDDIFIGGPGDDEFVGGLGFDTVDYSTASGAINIFQVAGDSNGVDRLTEIERVIGSSFDDRLGGLGTYHGGAGNDLYEAYSVTRIIEAPGQGIDTVRTFEHFVLPENVENLTLLHSHSADPHAGASVPSPNPVNGTGNALANTISGNMYANELTGLLGADTLQGGLGNDTFKDTLAGLNGDTITDFTPGDRLFFTNANITSFSYALSGTTLSYSGGNSLRLGMTEAGRLEARAAPGGGVELILSRYQFSNPDLELADFGAGARAGSWTSDDRYPRRVADVNGDGRADIVGFGEAGAYLSLGTASGSFTASTLATTSFGAGSGAGGWSSNDLHLRELADVNGDNRADIVGFGNNGVYVSLAGANGTYGPTTLASTAFGAAPSAGGWSSNDRYLRRLADVNGDGRDDIVGFGIDGAYVSLATASGTFAAPTLAIRAFGAGVAAGGWSSDDRHPRQLADLNGDGRADIVGFGIEGVFVSLAQANGTFAAPTLSLREFGQGAGAGGWTSDDRFPRDLADVNGDGKIDIVGFGNGGVYVALGQGNGTFGASRLDLGFFGAQPAAGGWTSDETYPRHLADVNNDGAADIVGFASTGVYVALSNGDILA